MFVKVRIQQQKLLGLKRLVLENFSTDSEASNAIRKVIIRGGQPRTFFWRSGAQQHRRAKVESPRAS